MGKLEGNGVDLHTHSTKSDGLWDAERVVNRAVNMKLTALALTDHNTITEYKSDEILVIPGCECNATYQFESGKKKEIHIIGLFMKHNKSIDNIFHQNTDKNKRELYLKEIIQLLWIKHGMKIDYEELKDMFPETTMLARSNLAAYMERKNMVPNSNYAFDEYFGNYKQGLSCYVDPIQFNMYMPLEDVVNAIRSIPGAIPVLCHPYYYNLDSIELIELVESFSIMSNRQGAMEVEYNHYTLNQRQYLRNILQKYGAGLLNSGGSDFHGRTGEDMKVCNNAILYDLLEMREGMMG